MGQFTVAALYQFTHLPNFKELKSQLEALCEKNEIKGIVLLADEGINGTVASTRTGIDTLKAFLAQHFDALEYKESFANEMPFHRMKVRLKKEIVTLGMDVDAKHGVGTYVDPEQWNTLINDPNVHVIDVRNDYEIEIGSFKGAVNPKTKTFREFPEFVESLDKTKTKKIAMYCTGGIRCEKASAYMLEQGFDEVFHLKGGILRYLEDMPKEKSLWEGECFVFDKRVAIGHQLDLGEHEACFGCRRPIGQEEKKSEFYERGVSCSKCYHEQDEAQKQRARQRQMQEDLAKKRGQKHVGAVMR